MAMFASFILMLLVSALNRGFVLAKLWAWFVVPTFGLPLLTIPVALGIGTVATMLTLNPHPRDKNKTVQEVMAEAWTNILLYPWLCFLFGWIYKQFM